MMDVLTHSEGMIDKDAAKRSDPWFSLDRSQTEGDLRMELDMVVSGAIVDSWVEPSGVTDDSSRLVLQVVPKGRPKDLVIVEAEASLVPDRGWLEDLGENLCHGSPVRATGRRMINGFLAARCLQLVR